MYFQLGGHNSQIKWTQVFWDDTALAEYVAEASSPLRKRHPNGDVELVLGLKPSGASHLLLTDDDMREVARANRLPLANPASAYRVHDFESLSPIVFQTVDQLASKLRSLKPRKGGAPSQANRNYIDGRLNLHRGAFEHGRLFYQILNNAVNPLKFGVEDALWTLKTRVFSFVYNVKGLDYRNSEEKKHNPEVLDIGFCGACLPALNPDYSTVKHIANARNKLLGRKNHPKRSFSYGTTEEVPFNELPRLVQELFKDQQGAKSDHPIILLVSKEEETMNFLRNMGVDILGWRSGLKDLLILDNSGRRDYSLPRRYGSSSHSREPSSSDTSHSHRYQPRLRSRSPDRRRSQDWRQEGSSSSSRPRVPARTSYAPVYVLDVLELYMKLMQMGNADGVTDIARSFKLADEEGWCAGNEAAIIIDIWREMISSLPIDEQRALRMAAHNPSSLSSSSAQDPTPTPDPQPYVYNSDDEGDPNEIVVKSQAQIQTQAREAAKDDDPYNFDESDYSSDD